MVAVATPPTEATNSAQPPPADQSLQATHWSKRDSSGWPSACPSDPNSAGHRAGSGPERTGDLDPNNSGASTNRLAPQSVVGLRPPRRSIEVVGAAVPHMAGQTEITGRKRGHKPNLCRGAVHRSDDWGSFGMLLAHQPLPKGRRERIQSDAADPPRSTGKHRCHAGASIH